MRGWALLCALGVFALTCCALPCDEMYEGDPGRGPPARREVVAKRAAPPGQGLLAPASAPHCEGDGPDPKRAALATAESDPNGALALRIRLEYERECYRRAELRVRKRLEKVLAAQRAAAAAAPKRDE